MPVHTHAPRNDTLRANSTSINCTRNGTMKSVVGGGKLNFGGRKSGRGLLAAVATKRAATAKPSATAAKATATAKPAATAKRAATAKAGATAKPSATAARAAATAKPVSAGKAAVGKARGRGI